MRSIRSSSPSSSRSSSPAPAVRRGLGAVLTTGALALSLLPASAASAAEVAQVRVKVADQPAVALATTPKTWPQSLLTDHGVDVDGNDLVRVTRDGRRVSGTQRRLRAGDTVTFVDVTRRTKVKRVSIAPRTVTVPTTKLKPGRRKVTSRGEQGVRRITIVKRLHNGEFADRRVVARKVVRPQKPRRVLVGRRAATSVQGADGLNWGALANCESGGNPRAVNAAGYYGLYQFNVGTWRSVGGSGMPHLASPAEQTFRAKILYKSRGRSPWPYCGRFL